MREQLLDDGLDGVDRDREADAGGVAAPVASAGSSCALIPITWPRVLMSGPPELPWLIVASVWIVCA